MSDDGWSFDNPSGKPWWRRTSMVNKEEPWGLWIQCGVMGAICGSCLGFLFWCDVLSDLAKGGN